MCGIIGYAGSSGAGTKILQGLRALEYRGYDSAGMTVFADDGLRTVKTAGRVNDLAAKADGALFDKALCGIGHTRWATHGEPSERNAHPHGTQRVMLVHNGIIENDREIRQRLTEQGCRFCSDTDTEAAAMLLDYEYGRERNCVRAIVRTTAQLKGSYAFGIVFRDDPDTVYATKKDSPLLIGLGKKENFIASDISAFIRDTSRFIRLEDGEIAKITEKSVTVYDADGQEIEKPILTADRRSDEAEKGGFRHFMLKEIFEEPKALSETLHSLTERNLRSEAFFDGIETVHIAACGTAMHAGLLGKYYIEKLCGIRVNVEIASEFRYQNPILHENDLVIIISQSGETADSLAAMRLAKARKIRTLAIVNTVGSTIATEADYVLYTKAGPEIAVASTKAFSVQTLALLVFALETATRGGYLSPEQEENAIRQLRHTVVTSLEEVLTMTEMIRSAAEKTAEHHDVFFIGRGFDWILGMEASLKLKEISYIHSEAYAAGELKHGTISLIEKGTPVIALAADDTHSDKMRSNIEEVKSRGAFVIAIGAKENDAIRDAADVFLPVPADDPLTRPLTVAAVIQLFAYYTALFLGRDIDKPRNLAKSVTVE